MKKPVISYSTKDDSFEIRHRRNAMPEKISEAEAVRFFEEMIPAEWTLGAHDRARKIVLSKK